MARQYTLLKQIAGLALPVCRNGTPLYTWGGDNNNVDGVDIKIAAANERDAVALGLPQKSVVVSRTPAVHTPHRDHALSI